MSDQEYEYKVQHQQIYPVFYHGWSETGLGDWTDEETAVRRFKDYVREEQQMAEEYGRKDYNYRIIRRPKNSETVYLTEGEDV